MIFNLNMVVDDYIASLYVNTKRETTRNLEELEMTSIDDMEQNAVVRRNGSSSRQDQSVGVISLSVVQPGNYERDAGISFVSSNVRSLDSGRIRSSREPFDDNDVSYSESTKIRDRLSGFSFSLGSLTVKW